MYELEKYLKKIDEVIKNGPYSDNWHSLSSYKVPDWYKEAKFGIFIHWGVFSVPAFANEWYPRNMYIKDSPEYNHHIETYGKHTEFGYKDFIPMFKAEKFVPEEWAELFSASGAKYVVPVAEHHDGFQMYKSEISHWNAYEKGPERDVLGELKTACGKLGIELGASSHRAEHWFFMGGGKDFESDIKEPLSRGDLYWPSMPSAELHDIYSEPKPTEEYLQDWLVRTCEIVDNYRPKIVYFDWWIQHQAFKPYLKKLAAFYYNLGRIWGEEVSVCYKHDAFMFGSGIVEMERGGFREPKPYPWQTDTAVARNSWCYTDSLEYKTSGEIICTLADVVSKNGNLLLNIGPKADGSIPDEDKRILKDLGQWMKVNGEAIKGARVWRKSEEGSTKTTEGQFSDQKEQVFTTEDYRFTVNHGNIYAIALKSPGDGRFLIKSLADSRNQDLPEFHGIISGVDILGYRGRLKWRVDERGLSVLSDLPESEFPVVVRVRVE